LAAQVRILNGARNGNVEIAINNKSKGHLVDVAEFMNVTGAAQQYEPRLPSSRDSK